jgi:hypothetical protein
LKEWELINGKRIAVDGTKVHAQNARTAVGSSAAHKNFNDAKLKRTGSFTHPCIPRARQKKAVFFKARSVGSRSRFTGKQGVERQAKTTTQLMAMVRINSFISNDVTGGKSVNLTQ